jgi:hypothetical protein
VEPTGTEAVDAQQHRIATWHFFWSSRSNVAKPLNIHDRVSWNSETGRVSGTIIRVHTRKFEVKGYTHHASPDDPQYEIKSSKTDHIAFHKRAALTPLDD